MGFGEEDEFFEHGRLEVQTLFEHLSALGLSLPSAEALDFGCGIGRLTQALAPFFERVHGVDVSEPMIRQAREQNRFGGRCVYHVNTAQDLRFLETDRFSFVLSALTLQHMPPRLSTTYLGELGRVLAPRGLLAVQVLADRKPANRLVSGQRLPPALRNLVWRLKAGRSPWMELFVVKPGRVIDILQRSGLRIIEAADDDREGNEWVSFRYIATKETTA